MPQLGDAAELNAKRLAELEDCQLWPGADAWRPAWSGLPLSQATSKPSGLR